MTRAEVITPLLNRIPMVERPQGHVPLKLKLAFTLAILTLYFALGNIPLFGLSPEALDFFSMLRFYAGTRFSLAALGVLPIIYASIILQIAAGPKMLKLDLSNPKDQTFYMNLQKLFVFCIVVLTSYVYTVGFYMPDPAIAGRLNVSLQFISSLLFLQLCIGGILIYYMEEVVSRWGIGSGVSLFIVASVSEQLVTGLINGIPGQSGWSVYIVALITTLLLFLAVLYFESAEIDLSPSRDSNEGLGQIRYPVKILHFFSVIAVPLVFLNIGRYLPGIIQALGRLLYSRGYTLLGEYNLNVPVSGLMYYLDPIYGPWDWVPPLVGSIYPSVAGWQLTVRLVVNLGIIVLGSMLSAWIWIKLSPGLERRDIEQMIGDSDLPIEENGEHTKALIRKIAAYTPSIAIASCGLFSILLAVATMFGTLGAVGAGRLILAISIVYGSYEEWR
jgi:preprotein translocase subunit SecY